MQGYTWSSNQRPSPRYQDRAPPLYQERLPHQYQERPPPQYQERPPPQYQERLPQQYQERPPPQYQERFPQQYQEQYPPQYHAARNDQPNAFQGQFMPQLQTTQGRYSNVQQEAGNQWRACSKSVDSSAFQHNGFNWLKRTNEMHPQYQNAPSHPQQNYPSDNPKAYRHQWQWHDCSPQNYKNTDCSQAPMHWSPQSDHGSSMGNGRGWNSHNSNNGNSCSMNNQQQLQPARMAHHHQQQQQQQQQQQFSRQYSGKKRSRHTQPYSRAYNSQGSQKNSNSQAQSRTEASHTSCNSTTPPSGAQSNVSFPSNNLNQSPVNQNQSEPGLNTSPVVVVIQSQNNAGHQDTNNGTYNVNQASQMTQASEAQLQPHAKKMSSYVDSIIYRLLCSDDNKPANNQQSHQNTRPEQSEVCATKRTDHQPFSIPSAQCTVEPPSKRIKYAVIQRDCWNKLTIVSKDKSDFRMQSAQPGTQSSNGENGCKGTSQHKIQYSTDPADCLEVVFALQKAAQQSHKAIAIVPPISQQTSNSTTMADTSPNKADSPPLKIDSIWSLVEESNEQKAVNEKLSESSTQMAQQENKSLETESNIESPDTCFASLVECQNDLPQSDCVIADPLFDLSSVPVTEYTLGKLMDIVKSVEMAEFSSGCLEQSESVFKRILKLYWNGNASNMLEVLKSFEEIDLHLSEEYAKDYESVVFESIETVNLKKLAHCDILKHDVYLTSEEFRSSWLNVDGQPADIEKVLSEPLSNDITFKSFSDNTVVASASLGVNSLTDMPELSSKEKSVNPDTCSPTDLSIQKAGNDREEVTTENNGHSEGEKQEDISQKQKPSEISPLSERSTEKLTDLSNAKDVFRQDPEQTRDNVSDSLSQSPGDSAVSTETHCNFMDTWQVEDISDDENPGKKEAPNNSLDTLLVEDISDDENPGSNETVINTCGTWLVEDISDDDSSGNKEVLLNSSNTLQVEDTSNNENPGVEDVSLDENSNNDSIFMGITVLSSEDAKNLFQQFEKEPECTIKIKSQSNIDCFNAPSLPNHECNKANTCSRCGTEIAIANSTNSTKKDSDADLFCLQCWEQAPLFELDEEPCSPMTDEANFLGSPAKSKGLGQNCSLPCLKMEVGELTVASAEECIAYEALKGQKSDCLVKSKLGQSSLKMEVEKPTVAPNEECIADEGLAGQKSVSLAISEQECNYSLPSLELKVLKPLETSIAKEGLMGQKRDHMVKLDMGQNCSSTSVELKVKKPTVDSVKECIADEGQKSDCMIQSELRQNVKMPKVYFPEECIADEEMTGPKRNCMESEMGQKHSSPSLELKVNKSNIALPTTCIADEGLKGHKSDCMDESELGQNRSPPCLKLEVKKPTVASSKDCTGDKGLTGENSYSMLKPAERELTEIQPNKQKNKKTEKIIVPKLQSLKQCGKPFPKKTAKHKLKSGSTSTGSDDSVLFAPDVVVKINWPRKKNTPGVSAKKRSSGESQKCSKVKKFKHRQERQDNPDRTSTNHRENLAEKVSDTPPNGSEKKLELHGILSVSKIKTTKPKKVKFDLYGSKSGAQCNTPERHFSAPATLTVSERKDYTDVLSAKQKVLSQWSSTFIPKTKKTSPPRSPQKKKPQKPQDLLKSNMSALKSHLTHRAKLLSSSERETSHFKKPCFHQKLTKTLSG
ncbi:hypothetical protein Q8A67_012945 [Cirrhinus molitorella]|uniref:Uncharacterized protein n=1 Tax=Cirrhinus molitorella TaxID=172907 RepID=A0AA88PZA6_9TELE|nr:hypothetical protein Q8A67_012945 [Cirrhinus molitorella]